MFSHLFKFLGAEKVWRAREPSYFYSRNRLQAWEHQRSQYAILIFFLLNPYRSYKAQFRLCVGGYLGDIFVGVDVCLCERLSVLNSSKTIENTNIKLGTIHHLS